MLVRAGGPFNAYTFFENGQAYLFCTQNLSVHRIGAATADLISGRSGNYPADETEVARREISSLVKAGVLTRTAVVSKIQPRPLAADLELSDLWLIVTRDCNLRCPYCFSRREYMQQGGAMGEATASAAVDFLVTHSGPHRDLAIIFFGGEPLLDFPLIRHTVAYARRAARAAGKQADFAITTNGVRLTRQVRRFLIREHFSVMISMDGDRQLQDANRPFPNGRGSFNTVAPRAKAFIAEALPAGLPVTARTTLNRTHLGRMLELYDFLENEMGFTSIWTPLMHHPAPPGFAFTLADLPTLEAELEQLADRARERLNTTGKLPCWGKPTVFLRALALGRAPVTGCAAGRLAVCIDPAGDIYPCERLVRMPDYRLGNVTREEYDTKRADRFAELRSAGCRPECHSCEALHYCEGACTAERLRYPGAGGSAEVACAIYRAVVRVVLKTFVRTNPDLLAHYGGTAGLSSRAH